MVRISKQAERRHRSPRRCRAPSPKTGPKKDNLPEGHKLHVNALQGDLAKENFIPKIR
jgi:hypothetical protein